MNRKLVIIEDDRWLSESYGRIIRSAGYEVFVATDADEAIDCIDSRHPDVIMLDMLLKRTTGMALLHELQSHTDLSQIPVVVISSMAEHLNPRELAYYGVQKVLDKETMTPDEMLRAIEEVI